MKKCSRCSKDAAIGYRKCGDLDTVHHYCSSDCLLNNCFYTASVNGSGVNGTANLFSEFTQLSSEDYIAYCAMEAL
jgi:hypothetical protein